MNTPNDGGPVFPVNTMDFQPNTGEQVVREQHYGMTLRDHFAGLEMQGDWAAQNEYVGEFRSTTTDAEFLDHAKFYYRMADAMIAARNKEVGHGK